MSSYVTPSKPECSLLILNTPIKVIPEEPAELRGRAFSRTLADSTVVTRTGNFVKATFFAGAFLANAAARTALAPILFVASLTVLPAGIFVVSIASGHFCMCGVTGAMDSGLYETANQLSTAAKYAAAAKNLLLSGDYEYANLKNHVLYSGYALPAYSRQRNLKGIFDAESNRNLNQSRRLGLEMRSEMTVEQARVWANARMSADDLAVARTCNGYWIDRSAQEIVQYADKSILGKVAQHAKVAMAGFSDGYKAARRDLQKIGASF